MEKNSEFARLEEFVDNLVAKHKKMKEACASLEKMLEDKESESARLKETIAELRSERSVVGERVSGLISRIEKWETELESAEVPGEADLARLQGKLFKNSQATAK